MLDHIIIQGAREHNLKNISLKIPRNQFVVITGVSGSGKSSLAFDTIYAEGQRRYVESLSAYARQFLGQMNKPDVDFIEGLSPAISIEQKTTHKNPRSTVGTVTEIYDYLRLLFGNAGIPHCHQCGRLVEATTIDQIVEKIYKLPEGTKIQILAPLVQNRKGEHKELFETAKKNGFLRIRIDNQLYEIDEILEQKKVKIDKNKKHTIDLVIDRLVLRKENRSRLTDSIELALKEGNDTVIILEHTNNNHYKEHFFSTKLYCNNCEISIPEPKPASFSFNSPLGACPNCSGLGFLLEFDEGLIIKNPYKSIKEGAIDVFGKMDESKYIYSRFEKLSKILKFKLDTPWKQLKLEVQKAILYGYFEKGFMIFEGVIPGLQRRFKETKSEEMREWYKKFMIEKICPVCKGKRLKPESLAVKFHGKNISEIVDMTVENLVDFFQNIKLTDYEAKVVGRVIQEIQKRLEFLNNVGVGYLTLSRSAGTLSGGEAQRIRLATQIGSSLMGVIYILDEPSIGLHQRDNAKLIETLKNLRDTGNTVLVVEHDEETMLECDHIIDLGPGAGIHGGYVVAQGTPEEIKNHPDSLTGKYLSKRLRIEVPKKRREGNGNYLSIIGAKENNLKNINVKFPLGKFICITGVSGSGKSTLVYDILYKGILRESNPYIQSGKYDKIEGLENIDKVIAIDQEPIGRTPRSNPATYTGVFTPIRELFANLPDAKLHGFKPGRFSFNVKGGRCENCQGAGILKIEMHFLPDVYITCDVCNGKRFNRETLQIKYKNKTIYDVLEMTVEDAYNFFENIPQIKNKLETLMRVGLDYIKLGQPATTLSGGEAQRVKLATELSKRSTGKTVYILDEPTTGLHFHDIKKLLEVLHELVDRGNTVIVIEHNLDVIKTADWIIDLGPEGGNRGGEIIAEGTPEDIIKIKKSYTGQFLKKYIE
ncbi:MAG: UvrABC system protein A [Leptospiraceae bacterium]|nr:MAG: UvrABC system protein A [Leptospiraceae bacterium]